MSLLQEVGAQLRAASDELPTGQVTVAMERLRTASELLMWVRQTSVDPIGVPQLANAVEHAERAAAALRIAQDAIAQYLAAVGLALAAAARPDGDWKAGLVVDETAPGGSEAPEPAPERLGAWWQARVAELTGESEQDATAAPSGEAKSADTAELLRRVAAGVRSGDRGRLNRDLQAVDASVGLALSAVSPPVLHRLAADLLGHEPRPADLPRLRDAAAGRVQALLPGTPPAIVDTLLARVCRAPSAPAAPGHPADSAVTAGVLTGILLARLGRDASTLDPNAPDPIREPAREPTRVRERDA